MSRNNLRATPQKLPKMRSYVAFFAPLYDNGLTTRKHVAKHGRHRKAETTMDSNVVKHYQSCIKQLLSEYESLTTDWSTIETIFDDVQMRYIVLRIGWNGQKRIHLCLVHIDIQDDMVIIQANNTEDMLDDELVALGVPHEKIHLGILPPIIQEHVQQQRCMIQGSHVSSQPTSALVGRVG